MAEMAAPQESEQYQTPTKERIRELVGRLRGTGGMPLAQNYAKSLRTWLTTLRNRGFLAEEFLQDTARVRETLCSSFPNSSSRSQFSRTILLYFYALTDEEFSDTYPNLTRKDAVDAVKAVASKANSDVNESKKAPKRTST